MCVCSAAWRSQAQNWCGKGFQLHVVLASCLFSGAVSLFHPRKETEAQLGDMCCGEQRKALPLLNSKSNSEMGVVWRVFFGD